MQTHELQSYVNQICEAITADPRLDLAVGAPLIAVADAIEHVAQALDRIAEALERSPS